MSAQKKKRLVIDLRPSEHRKLAELARSYGITLSNLVRRALDLPDQRARERTDLKRAS